MSDPLRRKQANRSNLACDDRDPLPYRRILVLLTGTALDTGVLRYLCLLSEIVGVPWIEQTSELPRRGEMARGTATNGRQYDGCRFTSAVTSSPHHSQLPFVIFHTIRQGSLKSLIDLVTEHEIDLILVGRSTCEPRKLSIRSTVCYLAMEAPCPVWVVPDAVTNPSLQSILVPMDLSAGVSEAANAASALAEACQIPDCLAVHVYFQETRSPSSQYSQLLNERKWQTFAEATSQIKRNGTWFRIHFEEGPSVSKAIQKVADDSGADLIVVATRQRSRLAAALFGGSTLETIESSRVPVLVVKQGTCRSGLFRELAKAMRRPRHSLQTS
ncbi:MAG: universal stress protein [Acidimicrobiia bacterium]|nr:universal stress protein [Acidimicrobiia bacterium]